MRDEDVDRALAAMVPLLRAVLREHFGSPARTPPRRPRFAAARPEDLDAAEKVDEVTRARAREILERRGRRPSRDGGRR